MWLAHGHAASTPGGRSSWLLRNMLAVSDCVCFAGRLTECQGSWGVAVWMAGQHGSARGRAGRAKRSMFPSMVGCSLDLSPPLLSIQNQPWYASFGSPPGSWLLMWSWRTGEWEEILVSFWRSKSTAKWSWIGKMWYNWHEMWQQVKKLNMDWILYHYSVSVLNFLISIICCSHVRECPY